MANTTYTVTITSPINIDPVDIKSGQRPRTCILNIVNLLEGISNTSVSGTVDVQSSTWSSTPAASGSITISSGSGSVGANIGGTLVTVTWATSDAATCTALATAINANSATSKIVSAVASSNHVTLTSLVPGVAGNGIGLINSGTGVTISGATLTGGVANAISL